MNDICENKHGGDQESQAANPPATQKARQRAVILAAIKLRPDGASCDEVAVALGKTPNAISGRFTELKCGGLIRKNGTRPARSGKQAGVWVSVFP